MDLPIYELMIDDNLNSDVQVEAIALVDKPAIQRNFMMFKENIKFAIQSE
jgi:hypothetical protein